MCSSSARRGGNCLCRLRDEAADMLEGGGKGRELAYESGVL